MWDYKPKNIPKLSVILTSYNHEKYIAAAIESVLNQTFADFELLIVDDGSIDNSRAIIKTFDDSRIKTFLYDKNRGPVLAIRDAVASARGKYIAVHHSDDLWALDKLEKQVTFLDANENYAACFTRVEFIDEQGNVHELEEQDFYKHVFEQSNRSRAKWLNHFFYNANCLCHPSAMVRRAVYEKYQLLNLHGFWQLPDLLMWIRLCFHAEIFILPERLTQFRLRRARQENTSATSYEKLIRADLEFYFIAREFADNFKDDKFFLEVFPEAKKFLIDKQINRRFALAKLCLAKGISAFQLTGLELLKNLLSSPNDSAQIKKLYNYDEKSFLKDSGTFDVFNLAQKNNMLRSELFIGYKDGFQLVEAKGIGFDSLGKLYVRFEFDTTRPANYLRFDPDTNFISLKIKGALINGKPCDDFFSNVGEIVGGFHRFWTIDPQIIFRIENLVGHVTFEFFGEIEENYSAILEQTLKKSSGNVPASELRAENENLRQEVQRLTQLNDSILNSNSWKLTAPLRNLKQWLHSDNKEKALSAARLLYKAMPLDEDKKIALKDKFYTRFAPLFKDTRQYKIWRMTGGFMVRPIIQEQNSFEGELFEQPGKIAIQVHIFYLDLLKEIVSYCMNMPYKFDALISITDEAAAKKVCDAFEKIPNAENVIVRTVPNRGRDVAPFLAGFGYLLPEYDFVLHIHSKKSLYTGSDQRNWREYLFKALLGGPERIRKIFKAFVDDKNVGVIYPRPARNVSYSSFTWLSNYECGKKFLKRANILPNKTDYFDFPAGTMFWARTQALKKILALNWTFEDFPAEQGQNDGTVAHVFERVILLAARSESMNYYEFEPSNETYTINIGNKNLWQYYSHNAADIREFLLPQAEIVSFDVFETLLMRTVAKPYHVNEIISLKVEDLLGRRFDFPALRVEAEKLARQKKNGEVTLTEIYNCFSELTNFDEATCKKIHDLEIATELRLAVPREEVVKLFKETLQLRKRIWIICDTCLQSAEIKLLLDKCGVEGYEKFLLSCETGRRKDSAAIWNHLVHQKLNGFGKLLHFGDEEMSDIQLSSERNFGAYHLMSAINLFSQVPFGRELLESLEYKMSLYAGIILGVILAKKFQSPFALREDDGRLILKDIREVGYWLYGVPSITFILRLIHQRELGAEEIPLPLREENFLKSLLEIVTTNLNIEPISIHFDAPMKEFPEDISELREGIKSFCQDELEFFSDIILRVPIDENFVAAWSRAFDKDKKIIALELVEKFS